VSRAGSASIAPREDVPSEGRPHAASILPDHARSWFYVETNLIAEADAELATRIGEHALEPSRSLYGARFDASKTQPDPVILQAQHESPSRGIALAGFVGVLQQNVQVAKVPLKRLPEPD
jgi:hypothetical protein